MSGRREPATRDTLYSTLLRLGLSLVVVLAYVGVWELVAPGYYVWLILVTYALLGGFGLVQLLRAVQMDWWTRKLGAIGVVLGFTVTVFLGLRPRTGCIEATPCLSGLTPHPLQLALGAGVVAGSLFLDVRGRPTPTRDE